jgi:hypothetical protein
MIELKRLLDNTLERVSAKSTLAQDIRYAQGHRLGLSRFLDDGRIEVDKNMIEQQMGSMGISRRNSLFAGSDGSAESWLSSHRYCRPRGSTAMIPKPGSTTC